jgi:hypothetical protein
MRAFVLVTALAGLAFGGQGRADAQQPTQGSPLGVGQVAPDFAIPGATRYGTLRDPVRLSDFRGKTVVLAFFYRARSPG